MAAEMAVEMAVGEAAGAHGQGGWEAAARVLAARGLFTAGREARRCAHNYSCYRPQGMSCVLQCCSRDPARWTPPKTVSSEEAVRVPRRPAGAHC